MVEATLVLRLYYNFIIHEQYLYYSGIIHISLLKSIFFKLISANYKEEYSNMYMSSTEAFKI